MKLLIFIFMTLDGSVCWLKKGQSSPDGCCSVFCIFQGFFFNASNNPRRDKPVFMRDHASSVKSFTLFYFKLHRIKSKKISNDQELIQSDPTSCPQNQNGNQRDVFERILISSLILDRAFLLACSTTTSPHPHD